MGLLASSTVNAVSNNTTTTGVNNTGSSISALLSKNASDVTTATKSVTQSAGVDNITKMANDILGKTTSSVTSSLGSGINVIESSVGSISNAMSSSIANVFKSTTDTTASTLNKVNPDPLKSSTLSGTPQAKAFFLNNQYSQTTPVNLQTKVAQTTSGLTSSIDTLTARLKTATSTSTKGLTGIANSLTKNSAVTSLYKNVSSAKATIAGTITATTTSVGKLTSAVSSVGNDFTTQYASFFQNLTGSSDISGISNLVDTSLPATTDANGNTISGIPSNMSSETLSSLFQTAKDIGCSITDIDFTKWGALQSFKSAFLELVSKLNITNLLNQLSNCSQYQDANSIDTWTHIFYDNTTTNPTVSDIAARTVNDKTKTAVDTELAKDMVTSDAVTKDNASDIASIFDATGVNNLDVYSVNTGGSTLVYDTDTVTNSPSYLTDSLLGDSSISDIINGSAITV